MKKKTSQNKILNFVDVEKNRVDCSSFLEPSTKKPTLRGHTPLKVENVQPNTLNSVCQANDHFRDFTFACFDYNHVSLLLETENIDSITTTSVIKGTDTASRLD